VYSLAHTNIGSDFRGQAEPIKVMFRGTHIPHINEHLTGPENYFNWCIMVKWLFISSQVLPYVKGNIPCPDPDVNPIGTCNWAQNDAFACCEGKVA
jgi:hypothetical protein